VVFSTNRNNDDSLTEECLLDSAEVLVGSMIENAELKMCSDQDILATNNEIKLLNEFECEVKKKKLIKQNITYKFLGRYFIEFFIYLDDC